jgi:GAF domain-containing protein
VGLSNVSPPSRIDRGFCRREHVLLRRLLREAIADLDAFDAALWVPSEDGLQLECALHAGGTPDSIEEQAVPVADSVVGLVASTGQPSSIGPGDPHNPSIDAETGIDTRAMVAAPVYAGEELCGVLSAINPHDREVFSREDLEKVTWRAYLLGLVVRDCHERYG